MKILGDLTKRVQKRRNMIIPTFLFGSGGVNPFVKAWLFKFVFIMTPDFI
jgi:hypothetical protein